MQLYLQCIMHIEKLCLSICKNVDVKHNKLEVMWYKYPRILVISIIRKILCLICSKRHIAKIFALFSIESINCAGTYFPCNFNII